MSLNPNLQFILQNDFVKFKRLIVGQEYTCLTPPLPSPFRWPILAPPVFGCGKRFFLAWGASIRRIGL